MKKLAVVLAPLLALALITPAQAVTVKAGAKCSKFGATTLANGKKFTCIKKSGKLVWNSGVAIKKPEVIKPGVCPAKSAADLATEISQKRANALISMTESDALDCTARLGWTYRVGQIDDEIMAVTMDYRPDRVTVTIKKGFITAVLVG